MHHQALLAGGEIITGFNLGGTQEKSSFGQRRHHHAGGRGRHGLHRRRVAGGETCHRHIQDAQPRCALQPFSPLHLNPHPDPKTGFGSGDEITFHDLLFSHGSQAGDEGGSCVIAEGSQLLANCTEVIRLQQGTITAQFLNAPPPRKQLAVTGGTGIYRNAGGEGALVESGNGTGRLTLHLLGFSHD